MSKPIRLSLILLLMVAIPLPAGAALPAQVLRNKGSDTMYKVAVTWAEAYQQRNQGQDHKPRESPQGVLRGNSVPLAKVEVKVTGGGTGNGLAALINGHVDIANASRGIKEREINLAVQLGKSKPSGFIVGWDAVVVLAHEANPLEGISLEKLRDTFGKIGKVTHWQQLGVTVPGCQDNQIKRVGRKNTSGTYGFFKEHLSAAGLQMTPDMDSLEYSREVVNHTANNPCAISYAGMAYITDGVKVLCLEARSGGGCVYPSVQSVADRTYPLARPLYMYTLGDPEGTIKDYLDWVRGDQGQKILKDAGYVPLKEGPPTE